MTAESNVFASTACLARRFGSLAELLSGYAESGIKQVEFGHCPPLAGWTTAQAAGYRGRALVHNYFPPPAEPFVLNLASQDPVTLERSLRLAEDAIACCGRLEAPFYSVHCGFLAEFAPAALGSRLESATPVEYEVGYRTFQASLRRLLEAARHAGIALLVEPNVVAPVNLQGGRNTLLMFSTPAEFRRLFTDIPDRQLGVLLDTGHLKVTAATLGFEIAEFLAATTDRIGAFHLHDNDGSADQHRALAGPSWMLDIVRSPGHRTKPMIVEASFSTVAALAQHLQWVERALAA